ncbi:MAG: TMEM175 family protein, partial [Thermoplasmata archaeon]
MAYEDEVHPSPSRSGRWREAPGEDLSRIIALSDGVFAFAMTLLVLSLVTPSLNPNLPDLSNALARALAGQWRSFLSYILVFLILALWWTNHHRLFRYIERYDSPLIWMNFAFLLTVAVTPFALSVDQTYSSTTTGVVLFAAISATTGALLWGMWRYATERRRLTASDLPAAQVEYFSHRWLVAPAVFLVSIG